MRPGRDVALWAAIGVVGLASAFLGFRTVTLSQQVAFLSERTIPNDVQQVMAGKLRFVDKAWHAAQAGDWKAADWYVRQVRFMANDIVDIGLVNSSGPLAELERDMFLPTILPLLDAMRASDLDAFEARYRDMVAACNACHATTDHAYVRIAVPGKGAGNWNQTFESSKLDQ